MQIVFGLCTKQDEQLQQANYLLTIHLFSLLFSRGMKFASIQSKKGYFLLFTLRKARHASDPSRIIVVF